MIDWEKVDRFIETYAGIVSKERAEEAYEREDWSDEYVKASDYDAAVRELREAQSALLMAKKEIVASGNWNASYYNWPKVRNAINTVLARAEMKETRG